MQIRWRRTPHYLAATITSKMQIHRVSLQSPTTGLPESGRAAYITYLKYAPTGVRYLSCVHKTPYSTCTLTDRTPDPDEVYLAEKTSSPLSKSSSAARESRSATTLRWQSNSTVDGLWALGSAGLPFLSESVPQTLKKGELSDSERRKHRRSFPPYQVSSNLEAK